MPTGVRRGGATVADETAAWAFVVGNVGYEQVHSASGVGPPYPGIGRPQLSPGTGRLFYWAKPASADGEVLVAEGQVVMRRLAGEGALVFSKAGARWAAVARERLEPRDDDEEDEEDDDEGPSVVVVDGAEEARAPDVSLPYFSGDGAHVAFLRSDGSQGLTLVVDGADRRTFPPPENACSVPLARPPGAPTLSPRVDARYLSDGRLLVVAQDPEGWAVFRGDERIASYAGRATVGDQPTVNFTLDCSRASAFAPGSLAMATEAPIVAWWERPPGPEEQWRVVVDGRPVDERTCMRWWDSQPPEFSPDGRHVAYPCANPNGEIYLVFDGRQFGPYADVWGFTVSDDGKHVGYGASESADAPIWAVYVDGQRRTKTYASLWRPRFSPRGDTLAWEAKPSRAPQGVLGVDGRQLLTFDEVLGGPTFAPSGVVSWVIRKGRKISRIDVPVS